MLFRLIWIGKTRNEHLRALVDDYLGRLRRFVACEVTELRESAARGASEGIEDEGKRIISGLRSNALVVLLDVLEAEDLPGHAGRSIGTAADRDTEGGQSGSGIDCWHGVNPRR